MRRSFRLSLVVGCAAAVVGVATAGVRSVSDEGETSTMLSGKAAAQAAMDQQQKELGKKKERTPKPGRAGRPASRPDPQPTEAGLAPVSSPFSSGQYLVGGTGWQQVKGKKTVIVYAGALAADPAQGVVIVSTWRPLRGASEQGPGVQADVYLTPTRVGPVELSEAAGTVLTLRTSDGVELKFNVATGAYLR